MMVTPPSITAAAAAYTKNKKRNEKNKNNKKNRIQNNSEINHDEHITCSLSQTLDNKNRRHNSTQKQTSILEFTSNDSWPSPNNATTTAKPSTSTNRGNTLRTKTRQSKLDNNTKLQGHELKKNEPWGAFSQIPQTK